MSIFTGPRPDITASQLAALLVGGGGTAAGLPAWAAVTLAAVLMISDAAVRAARNSADAKRDSAALVASHPPRIDEPADPDSGILDSLAGELPTDDEEFAAPPDQDARLTPDTP